MLASELRNIRLRLHLTQAALATRLRMRANTISRWERGIHPIPESVAILMRSWDREREEQGR